VLKKQQEAAAAARQQALHCQQGTETAAAKAPEQSIH